MNILWIRMQNAHKFLKIKFGTSKALHGWLWQVQAFPSDSWENVLIRLSCCPISVGVWEAWNQRYLPSIPSSWDYTPSKTVVRMVEVSNSSSILQGTDYILFVFDSTIHHPSPHTCDMSASHIPLSPTDYQVLCVRHTVGPPHILMEIFSMPDTWGSYTLMRHSHVNQVGCHWMRE